MNEKGLLFVGIVILSLMGGAYYFFSQTVQPGIRESEEVTQITPNTILDDPSVIRLYQNGHYGISFSYPARFGTVSEGIIQTYADGRKWYRIEFADTSVPEAPSLRFEVNADGYGPFAPDKVYTLAETPDRHIIIVAVETPEDDDTARDGMMLIIPEMLKGSNGNTYHWQFGYTEGGDEYESTFRTILSSAVITDIE